MDRKIPTKSFESFVGTKIKLNNDLNLRKMIEKVVTAFTENQSKIGAEVKGLLLKIKRKNEVQC